MNGASATVVWDPDGSGPLAPRVVVAGNYTVAGDVAARGVSTYDPQTSAWEALPDFPIGRPVALAIDATGALIGAGGVLQPEGVIVARFDGTTWTQLGSGFDNTITSLAVMPNGDIIAGGRFLNCGATPVNRIARWDGAAWSAMGAGVSSASAAAVEAMVVMPDGRLAVGGTFTSAGGFSANNVARWDGTSGTWLGMGTRSSVVRSMTLCDTDGPGGLPQRVVAGGPFTGRVSVWDGSTWVNITPPGASDVRSLSTLATGELVAGGTIAGELSNIAVRSFAGTWSGLGTGVNAAPTGLRLMPDGGLFAIGGFTRAGDHAVSYASIWNGAAWEVLGDGVNAAVWALEETPAGAVIAAGAFRTVGDGVTTAGLARWDGARWTSLAGGVPGSGERIDSILVRGDDDIIVGGAFAHIDGVAANSVARWDGASWSPIGSGVGGGTGAVLALAEMPSGDLIAGGLFQILGQGNNIARWNGTTWNIMGGAIGMPGFSNPVNAVVVTPEGEVFAGGDFDHFGSLNVVRFDGSGWVGLDQGVGTPELGRVNDMELLPNGSVVVGGQFNEASEAKANNIAIWNGSFWESLGEGLNGEVRDIEVLDDGTIVAVGSFVIFGDELSLGMARWNGISWEGYGTGLDGIPPLAVAGLPDGEIAVGGMFGRAGGRVSAHFSRWSAIGYPSVVDDPVDMTVAVGETLVFSATPQAGFEGVSVQWTRNGKPISDGAGGASPGGGFVQGATALLESPTDGTPAVLIVEQTLAGDAGEYAAVFSNECGEAVSEPAVATIDGTTCVTDFNDDGTVNSTDVSDFINAWFADQVKGTLVADWDANGVVNSTDVSEFINDWFEDTASGCGG